MVLLLSILGVIGWASRRQPEIKSQPPATGRYALTLSGSKLYVFDSATGILHYLTTPPKEHADMLGQDLLVFRLDAPRNTFEVEQVSGGPGKELLKKVEQSKSK
jgi:hypothetical protein